MVSWVALTGVERWGEHAPWRSALLSGLLWAGVVTGAWWFAEWTQVGRPRAAQYVDGARTPVPPSRSSAVADDQTPAGQ